MPNKINLDKVSSYSPIRATGQNDVKKSGGETAKTVEANKTNEDKLDLSNRATEVGKYVEQVKDLPDVRKEKVSQLKEQIASGNYKPSSTDIADAILKDEKV